MLKELLDTEMRKRGLSLRSTAVEIGVAHTTVVRLLKGDAADVPTLLKVCKWLNVSPSLILNSEENTDARAVFSTIAEVVPGLLEVLEQATADFKVGALTAEDLEEITSFIAFRLKARKDKDARSKRDIPE
jgi:transcriptional regulator with XRE-family HTH domain